jgi:heterodisulfide reductase subunit B
MNLPYFPGCTLKTDARHFEDSAMKVMEKLGSPLVEMEDWICCGTVFSMTSDDLMLQLAAIRNLLRAERQNLNELVLLCSMCYNTLKRAHQFITEDEENLQKVNDLMYKEEVEYTGSVEVIHLLNVLKDRISFETIGEKVENSLKDLEIGAYYGCLLLRPEEMAIDTFEDPDIIEDLLSVAGAETIKFPYRLECCGAYQTVNNKEVTISRTYEILSSARKAGCKAVVTSCPLCAFNLDQRQKETAQEYPDFKKIPIFYFTELLALALGCGWDADWNQLHYVDPLPVLKERELI